MGDLKKEFLNPGKNYRSAPYTPLKDAEKEITHPPSTTTQPGGSIIKWSRITSHV